MTQQVSGYLAWEPTHPRQVVVSAPLEPAPAPKDTKWVIVQPYPQLRLLAEVDSELVAREGLRVGDQITLRRGQLIHKPPPNRPHFADFPAAYPRQRVNLAVARGYGGRTGTMADLAIDAGLGSRIQLDAEAMAGKTTMIWWLLTAYGLNSQVDALAMLMVGERPEEAQDEENPAVPGVLLSRAKRPILWPATFDMPHRDKILVADLCLAWAKRQVEMGRHVVLCVDSLTRLARLYNDDVQTGEPPGTGGFFRSALDRAGGQWFGQARNVSGGGSLTIIGTVLRGTGNRGDDRIAEEYTGTGNSVLRLLRNLTAVGFPAIDFVGNGQTPPSGTRNPHLMYAGGEQDPVLVSRRRYRQMLVKLGDPDLALGRVLDDMRTYQADPAKVLARFSGGDAERGRAEADDFKDRANHAMQELQRRDPERHLRVLEGMLRAAYHDRTQGKDPEVRLQELQQEGARKAQQPRGDRRRRNK